MINFKKGPALSLQQVNYLATTVDGQAIEAGHVVRLVQTSGTKYAYKGAAGAPATASDVYGFAINSQTDGDVIASGVIGVYALDGASVIETDKAAQAINYTNYPLGGLLSVDTSGNVILVTGAPLTSTKIIGQVEGIRTLPGVTQVINGVKVQGQVTLLGIKVGV